MSLITTSLPRTVEVGGRQCPINTNFRASIQFELLTLSDKLAPEDILRLYYGADKGEKSPQSARRSYDFDVDADALFTSFRQAYGIDLSGEDLHWWAFRELMLGLPEDTPFKRRVYYRVGSTEGMSRKQKKQFEARRKKYALPERGRVDHRLSLLERNQAMRDYVAQRFQEANEEKRKRT